MAVLEEVEVLRRRWGVEVLQRRWELEEVEVLGGDGSWRRW